jgi:hypothetical protein
MAKISDIVNQNPWWKYGKEFVPYDRHLSKKKESLIFFAPILSHIETRGALTKSSRLAERCFYSNHRRKEAN